MKIEREVKTTVRLVGSVTKLEACCFGRCLIEWRACITTPNVLKWAKVFGTEAEARTALEEHMDRIERELTAQL